MNDMFDINLLSQIQALDRKFSVAKEKSRLKRKGTDDNKQKGYYSESKATKTAANKKENDFIDEIESIHTNIDITV
jgi:hypothetical protein